jgi:hypothetical protein
VIDFISGKSPLEQMGVEGSSGLMEDILETQHD